MRRSELIGKAMAGLVAAASVVAFTSNANASTVTIGLQQAGVDGGCGLGNICQVATGTGHAGVTGISYGTFILNDISGTSQPFTTDLLNSTSSNTSSTTAGTLNIFITSQGLTQIGTAPILSSLTSNVLPAGWTVTETTFYSSSNALWGGTQLTTHSFNNVGTFLQTNSAATGPQPFSVTEEYTITTTGAGNAVSTMVMTAVPEASTWAMMMLGFIGIGFVTYRKKAKVGFRFA